MWYAGYNRTDRDYMVFVDARVYCGIGSIESDDQPGSANRSNLAPHYGRIDAGCWSGVIAAHELMHNLGGVQMSAPHSDGNWHCTDGYDDMCDHSGRIIQYPCPDPVGDSRFDCNHDDYYSTNPAANSYLATHWNAANSQFLIQPAQPASASVDSTLTGQLKRNTFTPTDTFRARDSVVARAHVVDQNGASLSGATVTLTVTRPDGTAQCALSATSDANGYAQGSCPMPSNAPAGTWNAHTSNLSKSGYTPNYTNAVLDHNFTLR